MCLTPHWFLTLKDLTFQVSDVSMVHDSAHTEIPKNIFHPSFSQDHHRSSNPSEMTKKPIPQKRTSQSAIQLEENLSEIRKALKNLMTKIAEKDRGNRIAKEWRMVAMVLDRLFFWLYFCTIILSGLILLVPRGLTTSIETTLEEYTKLYNK